MSDLELNKAMRTLHINNFEGISDDVLFDFIEKAQAKLIEREKQKEKRILLETENLKETRKQRYKAQFNTLNRWVTDSCQYKFMSISSPKSFHAIIEDIKEDSRYVVLNPIEMGMYVCSLSSILCRLESISSKETFDFLGDANFLADLREMMSSSAAMENVPTHNYGLETSIQESINWHARINDVLTNLPDFLDRATAQFAYLRGIPETLIVLPLTMIGPDVDFLKKISLPLKSSSFCIIFNGTRDNLIEPLKSRISNLYFFK